jgi:hypothetical protein
MTFTSNILLVGLALCGLLACGYTQESVEKQPIPPTSVDPLTTPRVPTASECTCPTATTSRAGQAAYARTLIIGNSITVHLPAANLGWPYTHGMAASAPAKDFVHILTNQLQQTYPGAIVALGPGSAFEQSYWNYDLSQLDADFSTRPNLVIVRISENINDELVESRNFETHYSRLLDYIANKSAPSHKVICSTSFWNNPRSDAVIRKVAAARGYPVACLCNLVGRPEYMAAQFSNPGVAAHPNDKGMAEIARLIWEKVP